MTDSSEDRVHEATPARRAKARNDGDVAKSFELAAAVQMIGAVAAAYLFLKGCGNWMQSWTLKTWAPANVKTSISPEAFTHQIQTIAVGSLSVLVPLLLLLMLAGIASHWLQTGPLFVARRIAPDPTRLATGNWFRHVFSLNSLATVVIGIPKMLVAIGVLGVSSWFHRNDFLELANCPVDAMVDKMLTLGLTITFHVALALLFTSGIDFWLKIVGHQRRIRMSDQELRDELRMQNGDPQIQARRQRISSAASTDSGNLSNV